MMPRTNTIQNTLTNDIETVDKITDNIKYSLVDFKQSIENVQVKVSND